MLSPARLEGYMRRAAMLSRETVECAPFVCLFNPHDPLRFFNYARPLAPVGRNPAALAEPLSALTSAFRARARLPRFEFVEEYAPDLGAVLTTAGFALEARYPLLVCTPETFRPAPSVSGLTITMLSTDSPAEDLSACLTVQREGFGESGGDPPASAEVERLRASLADDAAFLARLEGLPVGVGAYTTPLDGLAELVGIATVEAYRRRGIGTAVAGEAARAAFGRGVEVTFLTAADEAAGRVYERVGFKRYATGVAYAERT